MNSNSWSALQAPPCGLRQAVETPRGSKPPPLKPAE
jgi:hypothetical protein